MQLLSNKEKKWENGNHPLNWVNSLILRLF